MPVLTPGQKRLLSASAYLEPSVLVLRRSVTARTRWTGLTLFITEHIVVRCLYPDCTADKELNAPRANGCQRYSRFLGVFVKESVKLFARKLAATCLLKG